MTQAQALQALQGIKGGSACGARVDLQALLSDAHCIAIKGTKGESVAAYKLRGGRLWVSAIKGTGQGMCAESAAVLRHLAREHGATCVAFQTARPGLKKQAEQLGFKVARPLRHGWEMVG